jgi:ABC-type polysaccharide/polyol phosphate export permease
VDWIEWLATHRGGKLFGWQPLAGGFAPAATSLKRTTTLAATGSMHVGVFDLLNGVRNVRGWSILAWDDLLARYRRTVLGPFWITLSHAFIIGGLAFWSSQVLGQDLAAQFVYIAAGLTVWVLISTSLADASNIFIRATNMITAYDLPASMHAFRFVLNQFLNFVHNLIVYVAAVVVTGMVLTPQMLLAIPGLAILAVAVVGWALLLGCIGARYRDVGPLVGAVTGSLMILTPIFWRKADIASAKWLADANPFFHLLEVVREPMLGKAPLLINWVVAGSFAGLSLLAGMLIFVLMRRNLSHWIS